MTQEDDLLTTAEVARLFKLSARSLERWRQLSKGPPYTLVEGNVRYPRKAVADWLQKRTVRRAQ